MCAVLNHPPAGAGEIRRSQKPHIQNRPRPSRPSAEPPPRPEEPEAPRYTRPQANYRKRAVYKAKDRRGLLAIINYYSAFNYPVYVSQPRYNGGVFKDVV